MHLELVKWRPKQGEIVFRIVKTLAQLKMITIILSQ